MAIRFRFYDLSNLINPLQTLRNIQMLCARKADSLLQINPGNVIGGKTRFICSRQLQVWVHGDNS
jgi:hypothetical protein